MLATPSSEILAAGRTFSTENARFACKVVSTLDEAEALRPSWSALLQRCERNELSLSPEWLLTWWRVFGHTQGRQLRLGAFHEGDRLVGLAPLLRRRHWYRNWLPFNRLELLASGEPAEHGIYSNHIGILAERGSEALVARQLVDRIAHGAFGSWDEVVLPMMSADTAMPESLVEAFRSAGYRAELTVMAGAPYIRLPATWDEFLANLSANSRRHVKRSIKAFDKWSNESTELEYITTVADLERGKNILMSLHHERWGTDGKAGVFHSPLFLDFHNRTMYQLAKGGNLELVVLKARGEPMAASYNMVWDNKVISYQTGRRTDVPANISPGSVELLLAIRRAIEQGRREFDLQADEAFYKTQLTPHVRKLVQVRAAENCVVEWIRKVGTSFRAAGWLKPKREKPRERG